MTLFCKQALEFFHLQFAVHPYPETTALHQSTTRLPKSLLRPLSFSLPTHLAGRRSSGPSASRPGTTSPHEPRHHAGVCVHRLYVRGDPSSSPARLLAGGGESRPGSYAADRPGFLRRSRSQPPVYATAAVRRQRPTRQCLTQTHHRDLHIQSVLLRRSRGCAGKDSARRSPSNDFMGCGSADELAEQEQGFGDALRTDMVIRRLRRKKMVLHLKIQRQEEEEDGATLDTEAEE